MRISIMFVVLIFSLVQLLFNLSGCTTKSGNNDNEFYSDRPFIQEYHQSFFPGNNPEANNIRSISVDWESNVWIATEAGVFIKSDEIPEWRQVIKGEACGPSYSVVVDDKGVVWMGTWDGIYSFSDGQLQKHNITSSPVSVICTSSEGTYCLGPNGVWLYSRNQWVEKDYPIARSIRDAVSDGEGGLWVATDAGLYHCKTSETVLYQNEQELISCYLTGLSTDGQGQLWAGGMGGVTVRRGADAIRMIRPENGLSSAFVNSVDSSPEGVMWIGTNVGVVRYYKDGRQSLRFSRRWLVNDKVNDVTFDHEGNAWIATAGGVSAIKRKKMTLALKADYFYDVLMKRHIRDPWIAGQCRLKIPGDTASWVPVDDDNDGEYTAIYLSMESLRYAVTKNEEARENAVKAFAFLKYLQEVTETDGFFARSIVPADWTEVNDINRTYTKKQIAEELVKDPRFKPVETRWHPSKNGKWLWKGDTSSDEMCGHMMGYFYYYEFAADEKEKEAISQHVQKIMDYLIAHNYNFVDIDGTHTRWGVWSPDKLNREPDWSSERSLNSFELLAYLKLAYHVSGDQKYQNEYMRLIKDEKYLENISMLNRKNPAWFIYFDVSMAGYLFPILIKYEKDPELKIFYENLIDEWFENQIRDESALNNFTYNFARGKRLQIKPSIQFLVDTPLDLVDWRIDHRIREDVRIVREPTLEDFQTDKLVPPSIRSTVRWDKNPWAAVRGHPGLEREPVFWLLPYWMGRYIGVIGE